MNTKDFLRLGVPPGEATRRATDFVAQYILGGGEKAQLPVIVSERTDFNPAWSNIKMNSSMASGFPSAIFLQDTI